MTKQSTCATLTAVATVPFLVALTNFVMVTLFDINFLPEGNSDVNAVGGFVCWMSFAVTTWVVYKGINRLTESY